jgi:zinc transporter
MTTVRVALPDDHGLIAGFVFRAEKLPVAIGWKELAQLADACRGGFAWLHFNLSDVRAQEWIRHGGFLPKEASDLILATDSRIRLDLLGSGIAGVLRDLHHDFDLDPENLGLVRFHIQAGLVVSGRRHPLRAIDKLRMEIITGTTIPSPIAWLAHLFEHLAETFATLLENLTEQVGAIEDRLLEGHFHHEGAGLNQVRRLMNRLRHHLNPEHHELTDIIGQLPAWSQPDDAVKLRGALGRLESFGQDLELLYERSRLLQEEIAGHLGESTNRNLYVLSIVTTVFLPMSLVTGLFGVNVGGMPWQGTHAGFWIITSGMLAFGVATFLLLHWRRMF